ncbi:MAG TPA: GSCFA domain-containing protein [Chitinophagaceae bacterium]|nr:GSCFA domain-containing protein [Chitinophagaceae bacterium]
MQFQLPIQVKEPEEKISYRHKILLTGSCFTKHIGTSLEDLKFSVLQNPTGILFDPLSVCNSLISYIHPKQFSEADLFYLNELWHSWHHHSRYSHIEKESCIIHINESQKKAHEFLKEADWLIITLGSSFSYRLTEEADKANMKAGVGVANCHRAPAKWFEKHLLAIDEIISNLESCYQQLLQFNSKLKIVFTISPVRHVRDGVVENNRSKARLLEAVHRMVESSKPIYYFPAYELVIDVLRDYRFYDIDLVHPNYMATEFVLEKFAATFIEPNAMELMEELRKIVIARKHKPFQSKTKAHKEFLLAHAEKSKILIKKYPFLDLQEELNYFTAVSETL